MGWIRTNISRRPMILCDHYHPMQEFFQLKLPFQVAGEIGYSRLPTCLSHVLTLDVRMDALWCLDHCYSLTNYLLLVRLPPVTGSAA